MTAKEEKYDVFLSHNIVDKPWACRLKTTLQAHGLKVWLDKDEIRPGELVVAALERGLRESRAVALVVSPEALHSGWVQEEYSRAITLSVQGELNLIPLLRRDAELPGFLANRSSVDFRTDDLFDDGVDLLVWGITGKKVNETPGSTELTDRESYIKGCVGMINAARAEVILITNKLHKSTERQEARVINKALVDARTRDVPARILVADGYDRLPGAIELENKGIEVRFQTSQHLSDASYLCVDSEHVIVATRGVSTSSQDYRHSDSWVQFKSARLASMLRGDFDTRWRSCSTRTISQHLRELLPSVVTDSTLDEVSIDLAISRESIQEYLKKLPMIVFLVGRPGSGKTTIGDAMVRQLSAASTFRRGIRLSDLPFIRNAVLKATPEDPRFESAENGGFLIKDPAFYKEALRDLARQTVLQARVNDLLVLEFARQSYCDAFQVLAENGVFHDLAVYLDVSLQTALKRNRMRAARRGTDDHYVAEREMIETFGQDDITQILKSNQWKNVIRIENDVDLVPEVTKANEIIEIIKQTLRWHGQ